MFKFKSKKITLPLLIGIVAMTFIPALSQAEETYGTGSISAIRAAEQKAALAKKAEKRKKEAEAKKAAAAQQSQPATEQPAAQPQEK